MFRNILVCVDGSPHDDRALAEAIDIARASRARLTLLNSIRRPPGWICTPMTACASRQLELDFEREAKEALCMAVDRVPEDTPVTSILSCKPIRDALLHQAQSGRYDLIVISAGPRHARMPTLRGRVGRYVLDHCSVPVLILHDEGEPTGVPGERRDAVSASPPLGPAIVASS